jgi:hypothetical protein
MTTSDPGARRTAGAHERSRGWLVGALCLGAGLLFVLLAGSRRGVKGPAAERVQASEAVFPCESLVAPIVLEDPRQLAPLVARADESSGAPQEELGKGAPARAYLADYYGARWPEVEAKIEAWGPQPIDLDMPYYQRPWEEVEADFVATLPMHEDARASLIHSRIRWPEKLTEPYLREEFPAGRGRRYEIDESDLLAIETLVVTKNEEAALLGKVFTERIDAHVLDHWATGNYLRAPFTTAGLSDKLGFHSMSTGGHGWAITITLQSEECPDVIEVEHQIEVVNEERDQIVRDYLAAKVVR